MMISIGWFILLFMILNEDYQLIPFISAIVFASLILLLPYVFYKRITFKEYIQIDRYFNSPKIIYYSDIEDMGFGTIKTKKGIINLKPIKNADELKEIINRKIDEGKILENQVTGVIAAKELLSIKAAIISSLLSFIFGFVIVYNKIFINIDSRLIFFVIWSLIYLIVYSYLKLRVKENQT